MVQSGGRAFQGQEAFAQLDPYLSGLQDGAFSVNILRVSIAGGTAVALTEETVGRKSDAQTTVTTRRYLKQTWRKMPQDWELEASEQRPPKIVGEPPAVTYRVGSSPDALTPLTINMSDPGTGLHFPAPPADLLAQFGSYAAAAGRHDDAALLSLLTPDFTCTIDGKPLSHQASLKVAREIHGMVLTFPGYSLKINKFFVKPTRATAIVEEKYKGPDTRGSVVALTYVRVQHWVKTAQGWRIGNLARILS